MITALGSTKSIKCLEKFQLKRVSIVKETHRHPKKPLFADKPEGCADLRT